MRGKLTGCFQLIIVVAGATTFNSLYPSDSLRGLTIPSGESDSKNFLSEQLSFGGKGDEGIVTGLLLQESQKQATRPELEFRSSGIVEPYWGVFESQLKVINNALITYTIDPTIYPTAISASYSDGQGSLVLECPLLSSNIISYKLDIEERPEGVYIQLRVVRYLLLVLSEYKKAITKSAPDLHSKREIEAFSLFVELVKPDGKFFAWSGVRGPMLIGGARGTEEWRITIGSIAYIGDDSTNPSRMISTYDPEYLNQAVDDRFYRNPDRFRKRFPNYHGGVFMLGPPFGIDGLPTEYYDAYRFLSIFEE